MTFKDGIHQISNEDYHADREYISSSGLKLFPYKKDEYIARYQIAEKEEESEAMMMGTAIHTMLLEPELFESKYIVTPEGLNRTYKKDKEIFKELTCRALEKDMTILKFEQLELIRKACLSVNKHPDASKLLKDSIKESSFFLEHDGLKQKVRADAIQRNIIADLKTIDSIDNFSDNVIKFGYHFSAVMYKEIISAATKSKMNFVFIVVQKKYPYTCIIRQLSEELTQLGESQYQKAKKSYREIQETGEWDLIQEVQVPRWFNKNNTTKEEY